MNALVLTPYQDVVSPSPDNIQNVNGISVFDWFIKLVCVDDFISGKNTHVVVQLPALVEEHFFQPGMLLD